MIALEIDTLSNISPARDWRLQTSWHDMGLIKMMHDSWFISQECNNESC